MADGKERPAATTPEAWMWRILAEYFADELVERWHRPESAHALPLAQFMGLTDEQYAAWVEGRWADVLA